MNEQITKIAAEFKKMKDQGVKKVRLEIYDTTNYQFPCLCYVAETYLDHPDYHSPVLKSGKLSAHFLKHVKPQLPCDEFKILVVENSRF